MGNAKQIILLWMHYYWHGQESSACEIESTHKHKKKIRQSGSSEKPVKIMQCDGQPSVLLPLYQNDLLKMIIFVLEDSVNGSQLP